ncbi:hypothetical protein JCM11491_002237 [Sporobolomyces phaffii]
MEPGVATPSSLSTRLSEPLSSTSQLLGLLVPPLVALDLVPDLQPSFLSRFRDSASLAIDPTKFVKRQLGLTQKVLIEKVWPDWEKAVEAEEGKNGKLVFERWFVPPSTSTSTCAINSKVAISSYAVLSSSLSTKSGSGLQRCSLEIVSSLLVQLNSSFNLSQLYVSTIGASRSRDSVSDDEEEDEQIDPATLSAWDHSIKDLMGIPVRVANAWGAVSEKNGSRTGEGIPSELEFDNYASSLTTSYFSLLWSLTSPTSSFPVLPSALSTPLRSLMASTTFLSTSLPVLIPRIMPPQSFPTPAEELIRRQEHIRILQRTIAESPDRDLSRFLRTAMSKLSQDLRRLHPANSSVSAKAAAFVLASLLGPLDPATASWKVAVEVLLDRNCAWDSELVPKLVVCWLGDSEDAVVGMMEKVQQVWGSAEEMKGGLDGRRTYLTSLLLVLIASLPPTHPSLVALSRSPVFLNAVSSSLSTVSPLSRLLGMLVAEYVSNRSVDPGSGIQPLDFGSAIWEGDGVEKDKIRDLRAMFEDVEKGLQVDGWKEVLSETYAGDGGPTGVKTAKPRTRHNSRPVQATSVEEPAQPPPKRPLISIIGSDDEEDELEPYPLPSGPSPSTLEALSSADPSLYQSAYSTPSSHPSQSRQRGKLRAPVYIFELTEYLRGKDPDGGSEGQKKEEADQEAERVEMALREGEALIRRKAGWGNELKENAVNLAIALMSLQDNYELDNFEKSRQNLLVALIAGCPVEVAPCVIEQYFMPTYSISQLHTFLMALALAARELANLPSPSSPSSAPPQPPQSLFPSKQLPPALHRRLADSQPQDQLQVLAADLTSLALSNARQDAETTLPGAAREKLLSVRRFNSKSSALTKTMNEPSTPAYTTICAEYFILPLLNRFWLYLRDTATSTLYASGSSKGSYAGGPASSPILQPLLLSRYLATVAVLLDAARHAPTFLAVLAPETLALVCSLRPPADSVSTRDRIAYDAADESVRADREMVQAGQLEVILVVLAASHALDRGHTLVESSFQLLTECQEWAELVFAEAEDQSGGAAVGRAGRAAAGVLLRLEEIFSRWRGRVGWE